jgi:hypothetical protein
VRLVAAKVDFEEQLRKQESKMRESNGPDSVPLFTADDIEETITISALSPEV